jgi:heat shock protein HslJ
MKDLLITAASLATFFVASIAPALARDARKDDVSDTSWSVEQINGSTPPVPATMTFGEKYRFSGSTGCNPFFGIYGEDGKDLAIRTVAAANGPCDTAAEQQAALLRILKDDPRVEVEGNGKLSISGKAGGVIMLAPSRS